MRIVVNDIAASSGGALSILRSFHGFLQKSDYGKEHEWIFLLGDRHIEENGNIKVIVLDKVKKNWFSRLAFDAVSGSRFISKLKPDIIFSLQNTMVYGLACPQILYVHQSIPFQKIKKFSFFKPEERKLAVYQYLIGTMIRSSIKRADGVIVQTRWIRDAVIESTGISEGRINSIFPECDSPPPNIEKIQFDRHKFFYPASKDIYKNHKCICEAGEILRKKGIADFEIFLTLEQAEPGQNITYLGAISRESVMQKYKMTTLIFPSYIETVGLPLLEARMSGSIIIACDCPFAHEVLDGYENAYYFDPFNPEELARLMEGVLRGDIIRKATKRWEPDTTGWEGVVQIILETAN
ncbi:glycosyltransferase [Parasporobacterium paucivorans]|uniref:Glycosyltransferase involved in cell wall bisynthesis n=1 Tax=Parasporobacterium paucivorans DSM 15970 TaxID=1122934 RepID=A0A1M6GUR3_9FIRM|nr:glycosyltransferase [Parasporobacterium paucivorans]SHJ13570.1 Glycosyltransferase involved in cell wall bisynthesis [Parasporobacterium paucivorans DSM 15970]